MSAVLTVAEVRRLLSALDGMKWLIASLLYGSGLRVIECLRLRVKDVALSYRQILVRDGKGEKDRVTMLPGKLVEPLRAHLGRVRLLHAPAAKRGGFSMAESLGETELRQEAARLHVILVEVLARLDAAHELA